MSAPPDALGALLERFDRDAFDMPAGRARVRLSVPGHGGWDLEVHRDRHRVKRARDGAEPDAELTADIGTWGNVANDLKGGMQAYRAGRLTVRRNLHLGVGFLAATNSSGDPDRLKFRTLDTKCGRMSTFEAGPASAAPIVMLHGLGATKAEFLPTVPALAPEFRTIAVDLPGFGDSDKPFPAAYDARMFARWVHALLDALGLDRVHLLGHSMGGRVALEVGMRHPDRIDRLVLMTPSMAWLSQPGWAKSLKIVRPELGILQPAPKAFVEGIVKRVVPEADSHFVAPALDEFLRAYLTPRGRVAFYAAARNIALEQPGEFWSGLEKLSPEALFIWGRRDGLVPIGFARHVKERLPAARHCELDCGHVPQLERPAQLHSAIRRFLSSTAAAAGGRRSRSAAA
ncbi:MAG: 4,5:9,10-diseco-3-hydroxy-5,9,17-trioxoandrosta(10),2-diene-4-oate hydrolase [Thermoleophilaceae bacterium]|jgi:pimeloyl-ACP methyl ester carboxylesterase|nr:4,5:9,10-diseco-3-hydroxy-5,9,17-trioxoandrosta(10),2-diene-4-oate hydrolase [Thermoleophilaceae bacterium]